MLIEINLLPGPKKKRGVAKGISLPQFGELVKKIKDPLLLGAVGAVVISFSLTGFLYTSQLRRLSKLEDQVQGVRSEATRFANMRAQKRKEERLRDSLVNELQTIRRIDGDRYIWPHILEEVTKALPDYTWIVGLNVVASAPAVGAGVDTLTEPSVQFAIDGRTSDISAYTRFLRQLSRSAWIERVRDGPTSTVFEDEKALTAFSINVTFKQADSAFIRTVPLQESVR